jgi:hypothetical protein
LKKIYNEEVGLGPFVRLGYLLKCVNFIGIDEDGVGKPMVTINNLLYTGDFNPNDADELSSAAFRNQKAGNIYPSCYSNFSFEGTLTADNQYNDLMVQLLNQYHNALDNSPSEEAEKKKKLKEASINYLQTPTTDNFAKYKKILINPGSQAAQWRKEISDYYKQAMAGDSSETSIFKQSELKRKLPKYQIKGLTTPTKNTANFIFDVIHFTLKNAGSCQPSKILFPHQFKDSNLFRDWTDKPSGENPYHFLYNLALLVKSTEVGKRTWSEYLNLFTKSAVYNPQNIISTNGFHSLSSHAMIDSLAMLRSQNKITPTYHDVMYTEHISPNQIELHLNMQARTGGQYVPNRVIDNIMISTQWLSEYLEKHEENLSLGTFLTEICKEINIASGNSTDLKVIDNPLFGDQVSIVDFKVNSTQIGANKSFAFPKGGHTSLFKNLSLTGKIPDAQASTIAIGAQGPRNTSNIESVTYAAFLEDIEDRISHPTGSTPPNSDKLIKIKEKKRAKYDKTFIRFFQNAIDLHLLYVCLNMDAGSKRKEWFTKLESNAKRSASRMNSDIIYLANHDVNGDATSGGKLPISSIIPLKVNIGMEGISGILASNTFKLAKGILPPKYNQSGVSYMVSKEKQVIKGGMWETTIEGSLVLDDNDPATTITSQPNMAQPTEAAPTATTTATTTEITSTAPVANATHYEATFDENSFTDTVLGDFQMPIKPNSKGYYKISSPKCKREGKKGEQSPDHQGYDLVGVTIKN